MPMLQAFQCQIGARLVGDERRLQRPAYWLPWRQPGWPMVMVVIWLAALATAVALASSASTRHWRWRSCSTAFGLAPSSCATTASLNGVMLTW